MAKIILSDREVGDVLFAQVLANDGRVGSKTSMGSVRHRTRSSGTARAESTAGFHRAAIQPE